VDQEGSAALIPSAADQEGSGSIIPSTADQEGSAALIPSAADQEGSGSIIPSTVNQEHPGSIVHLIPDQVKTTVSFKDLVAVPQRKRRETKPRQQLASYHLTSPEHLDFVDEKNKKTSSTKTKKLNVSSTSRKSSAMPIEQAAPGAPVPSTSSAQAKRKKTPSTKTKKAKGAGHEKNPCKICFGVWGSANDKKKDEEWVDCNKCKNWFHDSCGQSYGIFDDDYFTCRMCC
jgi:hypothetical protein